MKTQFRSVILLVSFVLCAFLAHAQAFEVPQNYSLNTAEDFTRYEPDIVNCAGWLEGTPVKQETEKRKDASRFLLTWLTGSPDITMEIQPYVGDITRNNPELIGAYMGGWARYAIQHKSDYDKIQAHLEAVKSALKLYKLGGMAKSKLLDKLVAMNDTQLNDWVKSKVKV